MGDARPLLDEELHDLVRDAVADVSSAARSPDLGSDRLGRPAAGGRELRVRPHSTILPLPAGEPAGAASLVLTGRIPVSQLQVGDIMVFPNPNHPQETIVHRISWLSHNSHGDVLVKTKGDYNDLPDSWTLSRAASADADKVTLVIPGAGTLAAGLQTVGIWGLVVLVTGAVGWYGVRKARSILAEDDHDEEPTPVGGGT